MRKIKILALSMVCIMGAMLCLGGCSSKSANEVTTIKVWHWMTDRQAAFQELTKQYPQCLVLMLTKLEQPDKK